MLLVIHSFIQFIHHYIFLRLSRIELGMELGIDLRINNARRTVLARVSGLVLLLFQSKLSLQLVKLPSLFSTFHSRYFFITFASTTSSKSFFGIASVRLDVADTSDISTLSRIFPSTPSSTAATTTAVSAAATKSADVVVFHFIFGPFEIVDGSRRFGRLFSRQLASR